MKYVLPLLAVLALILLVGSVQAATITAVENNSPVDTDVVSSGVIAAVNLGTTVAGAGQATATTVNGVNFVTSTTPIGTGAAALSDTYGSASTGSVTFAVSQIRGFNTFDAGPNTIGALDNIFNSVSDDNQGNPYSYTFSDLQVGHEYTFQLFMSSGTQYDVRSQQLHHVEDNVDLAPIWTNSASEEETIFTLTWTADRATETIVHVANDGSDVISGFVFASEVPEPASLALLGLGGLGLLMTVRRRRR